MAPSISHFLWSDPPESCPFGRNFLGSKCISFTHGLCTFHSGVFRLLSIWPGLCTSPLKVFFLFWQLYTSYGHYPCWFTKSDVLKTHLSCVVVSKSSNAAHGAQSPCSSVTSFLLWDPCWLCTYWPSCNLFSEEIMFLSLLTSFLSTYPWLWGLVHHILRFLWKKLFHM